MINPFKRYRRWKLARWEQQEYKTGKLIGQELRAFIRPDVNVMDIIDLRYVAYRVYEPHSPQYFRGMGDGFGREEWQALGQRLIDRELEKG